MKKINKLLISFFTITSVFFASLGFGGKGVLKVNAGQSYTYPGAGSSGTIMFVGDTGGVFDSSCRLAVYCFNSTTNAWTEKVEYRTSGSLFRVMLPYSNGSSVTWSKFIICRYDPSKNPSSDGFGGVYNQTDDLSFSIFYQSQNTIYVTGYDGNKLTVNETRNAVYYYGAQSETHMYLDLSGFTDWENDNAKFAIYFAYPSSTNENRWGQAYSTSGYSTSFCWKVNGQTNDHLYECVVPTLNTNSTYLWNMVVVARFSSSCETPIWDTEWNKTGDMVFTSSNYNANMIHIDGWGSGYLDTANIISKESRLNFYGQYFLDTVSCSGHGNSDSTTNTQWNLVKTDYERMSRTFQGTIWTTDADESGSLIAQAMARYDYIVLYKQYGHEDFINRAGSSHKTTYSSRFAIFNSISIDKNNSLLIVIIVASITSIAAILYFALKKKARR